VLQERIDEINIVPDRKDDGWEEFLSVLREFHEIIAGLDRKVDEWKAYQFVINECIPGRFREFALRVPRLASWDYVLRFIKSRQIERDELRELIRAIKNNPDEIIEVPSEKHLFLTPKGIPFEVDRGGPLSWILQTNRVKSLEKIAVTSLNICPMCDDVYWEKKKGSETCGKKKCSDDLGNWKRKKKKDA